MADLDREHAVQTVSIYGTDATGLPTNPVDADSNRNLKVIDYATAATGAAVPVDASFMGGKNQSGNLVGFNLDASGNLFALPLPAGASTSANQTTEITSLQLIDNPIGPVGAGTAGTNSFLIGGVFNTVLPTLTNGQQSAIQFDSSGRIIIAPSVQGALAEDHNYGTVGATTLRTASQVGNATGSADFNFGTVGAQTLRAAAQIGNATGSAAFGAGTTTAQVLRVVLPTDQTSIPIVGNVASGSADSGNPVKIGGVYNTVLPVVTTGQRVDLQLDANGRLLTSSVSLPTTASKFTFGQVTTSAVPQVPVEATAYTETTTNSTMTIVSASANDTSAGTGARTVTVTYLDATGAGPFTTTFTMNGTTPVSASVSNMCFVEKIVVATVGSTNSNVGILTLKTGGAVTVGTVAATVNQTFWAHHYIPTGKTSYITGLSIGNNATTTGATSTVLLKASTPTVANTPEIQISDSIECSGGANTITRVYNSPIQITGPARIRAYVTPGATSSYTNFASFDYIDN